ncbi:MAG: response regulator transcription factor [Armatimonadota bacterium]|nr:response regulator transcription factor [Armatimonadota bacterium]MDR7388791.1 response regulator transcription factor [Armatimonadota bacterium]MDR7396192.1 response regulator transcription factor [Armatimonadota bacterium]MDR7399977.1 response regulator transcription factor [Armatimonadota bacterium]MDR7441446.1 response regulator transcription factor [Armatimonadota bacterium]
MVRVLVVDDDEAILSLLGSYLAREGFEVQTAGDGEAALAAARTSRPDVVVLDVLLPGLDGLEVLRRLRAEGEPYVILLTAKAEEADRVVGLELGADDYVTKPFSPRELVARIRAVLRRGRGRAEVPEAPLVFPRLRIDPARREVWRDGERVYLTPLEFDLLRALASFPGRVWTREQLIERVWGHDYFGDERVVDAHIKELRRKLQDDPARPSFIGTVRGVGYRFVDEPG